MLQKILSVLLKIVLGIVIFYLIFGFIILPLLITWIAPGQASKFLKTPVRIHSTSFNPVLLKFSMNGFEILDHQNQLMMGFDKLMVHVSPIDLMKKVYHVEAFELDGLKINVELLPGNAINLLALVPPGVLPPPPTSKEKAKISNETKVAAGAAHTQPAVLPNVIIDSIVLHEGQIHFTDKTVSPNFSSSLSPMELEITNVTTNPSTEIDIKFKSNLDDKGKISMETFLKPLAKPLEMESTMSLNDYALTILTPYTGKYTGHELKTGKLDLRVDYRIDGNKLVATHKVLIQRFEFGKPVESKDALHLPFGLAIALLEDPDGKMHINFPVSGDMSSPKFEYSQLVLQVVRNFFFNLITKPFSFLASSLGVSDIGTDELGYVRFNPGKADLMASQRKKLITLIQGLKAHPKLYLEIDGAYDPQADWKAIQAESFNKEYANLKKISGDWPDTKLYQLLYQRHFGIRALWVVAKKYKHGIGNYSDDNLDTEIKRQLIENAPPDQTALEMLAKSRANLIHQFFLTSGFDTKRLGVGHPQPTQSSMGYIPMPFTLTVFEKAQ